MELSAQPEPDPADLHLRRRQPRDGEDERELAPPGAAADREACRRTSRPRSCSSSTRPAAWASSSRKLPFDHLLFTGSGTTGRAVMAAAAQQPVPGDAGARRQGAGHRLRRLPAAHRGRAHPVRQVPQRRPDLHHGRPCLAAAARRSTSSSSWRARSCRSATRAWTRRTTPRSSTQRSFDRLVHALDDARERGAHAGAAAAGPGARPRHAQDRAAHRARRARRLPADAARDLRPDPAAARLRRRWTR